MATPSVRLLLVRHAQHDLSTDDGRLTAIGLEQARALAAALQVTASDALVASPLARAQGTAAVMREKFETLEGLEEFRFGPTAPASEQLVAERVDLTLWRPDDGFAGGETLRCFQTRVAETLESLVSGSYGRTVVAVTHSGFIDAALRWAYGLAPDDDWITEAVLPNASASELEHWPRGRRPDGSPRFTVVHRVGDVAHLRSELVTEI